MTSGISRNKAQTVQAIFVTMDELKDLLGFAPDVK